MKKKLLYAILPFILVQLSVSPAYATTDSDSLESQAKERAANATLITEGEVYDLVTDVCPNAVISDYHDDSLGVDLSDIELPADSSIAVIFPWVSARILNSGVMDHTSSISFSYIDEKVLANINISEYNGINDFTSTTVCLPLGKDATDAVAMQLICEETFHNSNSHVQYQRSLNELAEKYGQETELVKDVDNDFLWVFSSFDSSITYSFKDNKAVINYRNTKDSFADGEKVWKDISRSGRNFNQLYEATGGLSFYTIDVVCFYEGTNDRLFEFECEKKLDKSWETKVANYYGNEFKKGVQSTD